MEDLEVSIRVWEKTIDVSTTLYNIELQIRNYALTLFTANLAGIGYLLKEKINVEFGNYIVPSSAIGSLVGVIIMCAFYFMDKYWYHKLLKGAVAHAVFIEKKIEVAHPEIVLTSTIGKYSPIKLMGQDFHSDWKYYFFYYALILVFLILYFMLLVWG
jgi:hypothetical protein